MFSLFEKHILQVQKAVCTPLGDTWYILLHWIKNKLVIYTLLVIKSVYSYVKKYSIYFIG